MSMVTVTEFIEESGRGSRRKWAGQRYEHSGPFHSSVIFVVFFSLFLYVMKCKNEMTCLMRVTFRLCTVPLETMGPFTRGKTSSLPNMIAANLPRWDENRNRGKDESNGKPR